MVEKTNSKVLLIVGAQAYPPSVGGAPSIMYSLLRNIDTKQIDVLTGVSHNRLNDKELPFNTTRLRTSPLLTMKIIWRLHVIETAIRFFFKTFQLLGKEKYDGALLVFPETAPLLGGWLACVLRRKTYHVYLIDLMADSRMDKIEWILLRGLENRILAGAKTVFSLTKGISAVYNKRVNRDYISIPHIIDNQSNNDGQSPINALQDNQVTITFSGQIHEISLDALQNLIDAVRLLHVEGQTHIKVQLFTNQPEETLKRNRLLEDFVSTNFFQSKTELIDALRQSTILFSPVAFNPRYPLQAETCFPTKTFDYIIAKRPILVHGRDNYFYTQYMRDNNSAYVVDTFDQEALRDGILQLINDQKLQAELVDNASQLALNQHADSLIRKRFEAHVFETEEV